MLEEKTPTREDVYDNFNECAQHEDIQFCLFDKKESEHFKYLDSIDYDDIEDRFYAGGHQMIDETFRATRNRFYE